MIDEINRGNISKIFGELITLIEIDKREGGDQKISATLAYSGHSFSVPSNVDIIGAMNTADRSLALVDTALRRRFEFIPIMPDTSKEGPLKNAQVNKDNKEIDVRTMLEKINQRIEALYDKDHTIGHAYFTSLTEPFESDEKRFQALKSIFRNRIIPLLEEYFFEDWQKIQLVLGDNQKNRENRDLQFVQDISKKDDLALFGEGHNLDLEAIQQRFQLNEAAFDNPEAYRLIYTP